jgi:peptidoglycan/LPS O-acetylase OafA/YrhL
VLTVPTATSRARIDALDGIRGLAILLVIGAHLVGNVRDEVGGTGIVFKLFAFGWSGVDLFFVLSGFLITGVLLDSKEAPHFFRNFYARRALRIFPLYFGALFALAVARAIWPDPNLFGSASPLWMWVYLTNVVMSVEGAGAFGLAGHFWSLAVEEHFYLVWPPLVLLLNRRQLMAATAVIAGGALMLRTLFVVWGVSYPAAYILTPLRMDALAMGAFVAIAARGPGGLRALLPGARVLGVATSLALVALILARQSLMPDDPGMQTLGYSLLDAMFGCWLVVGLLYRPLNRLLNAKVLRWFGKYSYGVYVWHPMIFILVLKTDAGRMLRGAQGGPELIAAAGFALAAMFAITLVSWHAWEKKFLELKRYYQ